MKVSSDFNDRMRTSNAEINAWLIEAKKEDKTKTPSKGKDFQQTENRTEPQSATS